MNPMNPDGEANNWLSYITLAKDCGVTPQVIMETLAKENIETRPIWKPMHLQPVFAECDYVKAPGSDADVSADIFARGVCLPSDIKNTDEEMRQIIDLIRGLF